MLKPLCEHFRENKKNTASALTKDYSIITRRENEKIFTWRKVGRQTLTSDRSKHQQQGIKQT